MAAPQLRSTMLDLLEFPAALLKRDGFILEANAAWTEQMGALPDTDFLTACRKQTTPYLAHGEKIAYAVESVLHGRLENLKLSVRPRESDLPTLISIKKFTTDQGTMVAVLHGDVSQTDERLRQTVKDQALKAAEALARSFAAEMNNILGAITGFTEMAREDMPTDSQAGDDLDEVLRLLRRAAALTSSMQAFGRSECLPRQSISFVPAVREALQRILPSLPDYIRIETGPMPNREIPVLISQSQLLQIFRKLLQNTWESTSSPTIVKVDIKMFDASESDYCKGYAPKCVLLRVSDNGPGMPPKVCEKIFDPLFTTKPMSAGMGLPLIQGIVSSLGGSVQAASVPDEGTRFEILLPILDGSSTSSKNKTPCNCRQGEQTDNNPHKNKLFRAES